MELSVFPNNQNSLLPNQFNSLQRAIDAAALDDESIGGGSDGSGGSITSIRVFPGVHTGPLQLDHRHLGLRIVGPGKQHGEAVIVDGGTDACLLHITTDARDISVSNLARRSSCCCTADCEPGISLSFSALQSHDR